MCEIEDLPKFASLALALVAAVTCTINASRFKKRLREKHDAAWQRLGSDLSSGWDLDDDPHDHFLPGYLVLGRYKKLGDVTLDRLASRIKVFFALFALSFVLLTLSELLMPSRPTVSCIDLRSGASSGSTRK